MSDDTTTTPTTTTPDRPQPFLLSAEDCAAIRGATSYVVHLQGEIVQLTLTRKERTPARKDGYERTDLERSRTIVGAAGTLTRATFVQLYAQGAWQALARIVRAGDVLRFYAAEDNSNGYLRAATIPAGAMREDGYHGQGYDRLYVDECCVDVVRQGRRVVERLVLCYSICPQNSARAVEPSARGKHWAA
jgi:hypothetical protein